MATAIRTAISGTGAATYVVQISKLSVDQLAYFEAEAAKPVGINPRTGQPYAPFVVIDAQQGIVTFRTSLAITEVCHLPEPKINSRGTLSMYPENRPNMIEALQLRQFAQTQAPQAPAVTPAATVPTINIDDVEL